MNLDLRNNLKRVGDLFVAAVHQTADTALSCSKNVFVSYDTNKLRAEKHLLACKIGERATQLVHGGISAISLDPIMAELVARHNEIEQQMKEQVSKSRAIANPFKAKTAACNCNGACEEKEQP
ncbi:MAG: hypothetical protein WCP20_16990 [Desulfuromonadales bacterium]